MSPIYLNVNRGCGVEGKCIRITTSTRGERERVDGGVRYMYEGKERGKRRSRFLKKKEPKAIFFFYSN